MDGQQLTRAYETMTLIRAYEEALVSLHAEGRAAGTCTSIGQEACAVGVVSALGDKDTILTNHRSAGHLLARGADPGRMMAEVMGKADGYCGGKSGSLHIAAEELGVVLTSTIVGGELGLATGVALSRTMLGGEGIVACFFGDGAAAQGRFHESLNLAAVWNLPILYVCENNSWQAFVHRRETSLAERVGPQAASYGMGWATVDGNDVEAVHDAAASAVAEMRRTRRPFLLELVTYRLRGHFEPDDQSYVDPVELSTWRERDPIAALRRRLLDGGAPMSAIRAAEDAAARRIADAVAFAAASPYPDVAEIATAVYA
jgi:TPP-dependent pyruvate/acetoin dehydrogenase alpha subunit